jgi:hypothetical protein
LSASSTPSATPAPLTSAPATNAAPPSTPTNPPAETAPSESQWVHSYPTGQWVYMNGYGWAWVPADANQIDDDGTPYVFLYTPAWGWTWYVSPWGWGPYHYGIWVRHPWHPIGWRGGWVAGPHVIVHIHDGGHYGGHGGGHHR